MDRIWERVEELLAAVDPEGLRGPAAPEDLDALQVPEAWRGLWGRHDGQTDALGGVWFGYTFLPLRGRDSVESDSEQVPDGYLTLATDFGGSYLVIDVATGFVQELTDDGETVIVAAEPVEFLQRALAHLQKEPPRRWVPGEGGRRVPEGRAVASLGDLPDWAIGEARDLTGGLVAVRVRSPDPAPFPQHGARIDFCVDHPEDPAAKGRLVHARLTMPTAPEGAGSDASAGVGSQGDRYWIEATGPVPRTAVLHLDLDTHDALDGPRPLLHANERRPSAARAGARLLLGDAAGALADLQSLPAAEPALLVEAALAAGDAATARAHAEHLPLGHVLRIRVFADQEPERALLDAAERVAHRPADGTAHVWRADLHERLGDFAAAAADTEQAIALLAVSAPERVTGLRAALRRRRARIAAPRAEAPILEDSTEDFVIGEVVAVEPVGSEWSARVRVTPDEAAAGRLVEFRFPDGERGAVRLPRGAGHGVRATVRVGGEARPVRIEITVELPAGWRSDGDNETLAFDKWDVLASVPRWKPRVRVCGPDGETHVAEWPEGEIEAVLSGAGLPRGDGSRGALRVVVDR